MDKVFISGPITGVQNYEENFSLREKALKELGYSVVNPVKIGEVLKKQLHREPKYEEYMKVCLTSLLDCDGISFLDGHENSKGSNIEKFVAENCGIATLDVKLLPKNW